MHTDAWLLCSVSSSEESAMRLDGEIYRCAQVTLLVDQGLTRELKLKSLMHRDSCRYAACGLSALWAWGLIPEPHRHSLALLSKKRPDHHHLDHFTIRDLGLTTLDTTVWGGFHVLTLPRLVREIASDLSLDDHSAAHALALCFARDSDLPRLLAKDMNRPLPQRNRIKRRLTLADTIDVVDGFDTADGIQNAF